MAANRQTDRQTYIHMHMCNTVTLGVIIILPTICPSSEIVATIFFTVHFSVATIRERCLIEEIRLSLSINH